MGKRNKTFEPPRYVQEHPPQKPPQPAGSSKAFSDNIIQASKRFLQSSSKGLKQVQKTWHSKKMQSTLTRTKRQIIYGGLMIKKYALRYWRRFKFYLYVKTTPRNINKAFIKKLTALEEQNKKLKSTNKRLNHLCQEITKAVNLFGKNG